MYVIKFFVHNVFFFRKNKHNSWPCILIYDTKIIIFLQFDCFCMQIIIAKNIFADISKNGRIGEAKKVSKKGSSKLDAIVS